MIAVLYSRGPFLRWSGFLLVSVFAELALLAAQTVSFERDVLPILTENCFHCHGPDEGKRKAGLRLDNFASASARLKSGSRAIVSGEPSASELITRVETDDPNDVMPPPDSGKTLTAEEMDVLRGWIKQGATYTKHWAFRPLTVGAIPSNESGSSARNAIDSFVLRRLATEGWEPSPEADRPTLVKRLYYDLLGLLPTPDDVDEFVNDERPDAYQRLIIRLLESEHFGERWGRHWLDKARYADSDGYEKDNPRPHAWRFRDWVIEAINRDVSLDQFTIEQLAGDLLPSASLEQQLATAFHRQTLTNTEGGTNREQWRVAAVMDRTETTGSVWLGLTVGCARCHTHKYDPISHHEYYQLYSFFNNGDETKIKFPRSAEAVTAYERRLPGYQRRLAAVRSRIKTREDGLAAEQETWEGALHARVLAGQREGLTEELIKALQHEPAKRSDEQNKLLREHHRKEDKDWSTLKKEEESLKKTAPASPYMDLRVVAQRLKEPRQTHVLERGEFTRPLDQVSPAGLAVLPPIPVRNPDRGGDRLDFARWLVSADNPLTPRVMANHIWANLFGAGLVATRNDFGVRGDPPSHPQLLDHLAQELQNRGWSRKSLIRYIVSSATYRQSSNSRPELVARDPKNRLLARQNRFRVEAEIVRDLYLDAGGMLSRKIGGASVFPPTSKDVVALTYNSSVRWNVSPGEDQFRRGLYTFFKRTAPHPNLMTFDCPDSNTTCIERTRSNTPLAALTTLNNEVFVAAARGFAQRVLSLPVESARERLEKAFRMACVREATVVELEALEDLLGEAQRYYVDHPREAAQLMGMDESVDCRELAAWMACLRMVLNLDEVITRD